MPFAVATFFYGCSSAARGFASVFEFLGIGSERLGLSVSWEFAFILTLLVAWRTRGGVAVFLTLSLIFAFEDGDQNIVFSVEWLQELGVRIHTAFSGQEPPPVSRLEDSSR